MNKKTILSSMILASGIVPYAALAEPSVPAQVFNVDENSKVNTTIGTISFLDGVSDKTVRLEVGTTEIKNWVTNGEPFESTSFRSSFSQAPIVFGQIQSNSDYAVDYEVSTYSYSGVTSKNHSNLLMRHRINNVSATGFDAVLESELDKKGTSVIQSFLSTGEGETLGWVAFAEPISGLWNDKPIEVSITGTFGHSSTIWSWL